jgi:adenylate cyclase
MEFTVLGDGVNLAARLESSTKQYGCDILVGQTAYELTRNDFVFRRVDNAKFKGKTAPIEVFTPLGLAGAVVPEWMQAYDRALDAFRAGRFEEAKGMFSEAEGASGGEDFLCEMYVKRCEKLIAEPPEGWDGSWTLTEK